MPSSMLTPAYDLTLGSQRWTAQAASIEVTLDPAPLLDVLRVVFPAAAPVAAAVGDPVVLALDGGEGPATVFTGEIDTITRGVDELEVRALDAGGRLARFRPAVTFEGATAGTVIRSLCDEAGVGPGRLDDGTSFAYYAADPSRTALDHAARVAAWGGALVTIDPDGLVDSRVVNAAEPDVALRYGRELIALRQATRVEHAEAHVVAGESGVGDTTAPEALRPSTDFFGGDRPDGPSASHRWSFEPALRTAGAAATAGAAQQRAHRSSRGRASFDAFLLPVLRPGTVLEVQDLPDGLARGPFWVDRVSHRLGPGGATTRVRLGLGGDSFDPMALLGSLAGALGGVHR